MTVSVQFMHIYGISDSSAIFSPNLASLGCMAQEILDKIVRISKMQKFYSLLKLVALYVF